VINEGWAKLIVSSWNLNGLRRLRGNLSRSHQHADHTTPNRLYKTQFHKNKNRKKKKKQTNEPVIESELLIEHLGEIKTHALKKIWLQRHCRKTTKKWKRYKLVKIKLCRKILRKELTHGFAMELFEWNWTWKVEVIDNGVGGGRRRRRRRNRGRHWNQKEREGANKRGTQIWF